MKYQPVIGLEVHVELKTKSKMFCSCSADYFGKEPNSYTCPVCLGLPGALPVANKTAIDWCVMIGMALNCEIPLFAKFDRKNYFYPDLAKGYQISQYDEPFAINGWIKLASGKKVGITRAHMEEDTAKLTHISNTTNFEHETKNSKGASLIDFNRSGVPLVEIVTEPDFDNAKDVKEYLQKLQQIVRYLNVSNADMEKGDMRLEPNISLRSISHPELVSGSQEMPKPVRHDKFELPKYKVEVKNINSFRFVEKAINYEIARQTEVLNEGTLPLQETRGWDDNRQKTVSQRLKEEANDYRYFPEPDIPPIRWSESAICQLAEQMPELPDKKIARFIKEYNLSPYDAEIITREVFLADFFEKAVTDGEKYNIMPKQIANAIINKKIDPKTSLPAELVQQIKETSQTEQIDEKDLLTIITTVLTEQQKAVEDYKNGKKTVIMFLVGQVMKKIGKKIDAQMVKERITTSLKS